MANDPFRNELGMRHLQEVSIFGNRSPGLLSLKESLSLQWLLFGSTIVSVFVKLCVSLCTFRSDVDVADLTSRRTANWNIGTPYCSESLSVAAQDVVYKLSHVFTLHRWSIVPDSWPRPRFGTTQNTLKRKKDAVVAINACQCGPTNYTMVWLIETKSYTIDLYIPATDME